MAADRIHLAEPAPPYCSSCFSQKPTKLHVDFGAVWDGPAIQNAEGVVANVIDDLVICVDCLRTAAMLVDFGDVTAVTAELKRAEEENDRLLEQVAQLREYSNHLRGALELKPSNGHAKPAKRKAAA